MDDTPSLFPELRQAPAVTEPVGLQYAENAVSPQARDSLVRRFQTLAFAPFDFRGFKGNRRTVAFGSRYDFTHNRVDRADPLPEWLEPLRAAAAAFADIAPADLTQALVTEYAPGAGIGWHRDRPEYGKVVGLSFGSACVLRFRRPTDEGWRRASRPLPPGSAYLLDGPAREAWQHSIAPGDQLRYSVTFRTLRPRAG
ncbi:alpha-ketoglutarate-dependent dioxygenase AlkB [Brevundimonas lutea]|uniref:alpha-ketoglutarate-dependent dioxygenase AlkB n=1 Tax=Brevundimonas lutea TaxID=2293980 RepID=UPI000F030E4D|nr:alpha-ketoglutarate-dependent dioxygenase AlkB [Brevundimonas lutea]